ANQVWLGREKGAVRYQCECEQYMRSGMPCKHVWAALLEGERNELTSQWETTRPLDFLPEDEDMFLEEPGDVKMEYGARGGAGSVQQQLSKIQKIRDGRRTHRGAASWKQSLSQLREAMKLKEQLGSPAAWPAG